MNKLFSALFVLCFSAIGFLGYKIYDTQFGVVIPKIVAFYEDSLQSKVTSSATSMTLVRGTDKVGNTISGTIGFVIEEGTSTEEVVQCSVSGTALTSCTRGISPVNGKTAITALQFAHPRGASVKITNFPSQAVLSRLASGSEGFVNKLYYTANQDYSTASSSAIPDKNYVDGVAIAGGSNATTALQGFVELATQAELVSGTQLGGTGATLVIPGNFFTGSRSAQKAVVTGVNGWITQGVLNSIQANTTANRVPLFTLTASAQGDIWYQNSAGNFVNLPASRSGSFLVTQGVGANPIWKKPASASATVTNSAATAPTGLTGATVNLTTTMANHRVMISFTGTCNSGGAGGIMVLFPQVDGASISSKPQTQHITATAGGEGNCSFTAFSDGLTKGSHTFTLRGNGTVGQSINFQASGQGTFSVYELY